MNLNRNLHCSCVASFISSSSGSLLWLASKLKGAINDVVISENCCDQFAYQPRSEALSFAMDITERALLDGVARFCSRSTSDLAEAGRKPALSTNILHVRAGV